MKKRRIAVLTRVFPAISETFILNQLTWLIEMGYEIRVFPLSQDRDGKVQDDVLKYNFLKRTEYPTSLPASKLLCRLKAAAVLMELFFKRPLAAVRVLRANMKCSSGFRYDRFFLSAGLFRWGFDLAHCHFGPVAIPIAELKKAGLKIPLLTSFHGHDINSFPVRAGADCYKDLFCIGEMFTANTNFTKGQMSKYGCSESKIQIIHESLRCDKFYFPVKKPDNDRPVRILTVGRMVEKKGYEYSLRAIAKVISKGRRIEYWAVGDGPLLGDMKKLAAELSITDFVKFFGALTETDVLKLYRGADLFMLPSVTASNGDREGQGLVLQEAQMAGLPVLSTWHNGIPDGVLDGQTGFLVPEKDVDALAEKLEYLIQNRFLWPQIGHAGQEFVRNKFDVNIVSDKLIGLYERLISL